jgi:hypothetical protein
MIDFVSLAIYDLSTSLYHLLAVGLERAGVQMLIQAAGLHGYCY